MVHGHHSGAWSKRPLIITALITTLLVAEPIPSTQRYHLITFLYPEKKVERAQEYVLCLKKNFEHPLIASVDVFFDTAFLESWDAATSAGHTYLVSAINDVVDKQSKPVSVIPFDGRPTFRGAFERAHQLYPGKAIIIANADIHFNHTLHLLDAAKLPNRFLCLSRWNLGDDGKLALYRFAKNGRSHDAWIYRDPLEKIESATIHLGTKHCDGRIAYWALCHGYQLINPCLDLQCCHVHNSGVRHYKEMIPNLRKMTTVLPSDLGDLALSRHRRSAKVSEECSEKSG